MLTHIHLPDDISAQTRARVATLSPVDQHRVKTQVSRIRDRRIGWLSGKVLDSAIDDVDEHRRVDMSGGYESIKRLLGGKR